jgi:hypothetical protein
MDRHHGDAHVNSSRPINTDPTDIASSGVSVGIGDNYDITFSWPTPHGHIDTDRSHGHAYMGQYDGAILFRRMTCYA